MELLFEFLFQFIGEFLLQVIGEVLAELGFHSLAERSKRESNFLFSTLGLLICGAVAGGISLLVMPAMLIAEPSLRLLNLMVTPVLLGLLMVMIGRFRQRRGQKLVRLDRFWFAFVFAWAFAMVRFTWAL